MLSMNQLMVFDVVHKKQPLSQKRANALSRKVAEMVAPDLPPCNVVENCGFRVLKREAIPGYSPASTKKDCVCLSCTSTTTRVQRWRVNCTEKAFGNGASTFAFISDVWTWLSNKSFLSLTCHFLTARFEMKRFTVCCCRRCCYSM